MDLTNFLLTISAGFMGTVVMTAVMYLYANTTKEDTRVVHILGRMITGNMQGSKTEKTKILATGALSHVTVGVLFSLAYFLLWNWGIFAITWPDALIVGALSGVIAIIVWRLYFVVHQSPPKISLKHYFIALFISHIIFGAVTVNIYRIITDNPQFWFQLQEEVKSETVSHHILSIFL